MKKRYIFLGIICLLAMFILTGCGKKTAISTGEFINITTSKDLQVANIINQFPSFPNIKEATLALSENNNTVDWQMEFYIINSSENAKSMFENNKKILEDANTKYNSRKEINMNNYSTYTMITDNYYLYLSQVDNTFLYVNVPKSFKDDVQSIIKELKY